MAIGVSDADSGSMAGLDRAFSVLWLVGGLALCAYARSLGLYGPSGPRSGFFLLFAGLLMTFAGVALLVNRRRRAAALGRWPRGAAAWRVLLVLAGTAAMIAVMPWLGFLGTALLGMPLLLSVVERRSLPFVLVVGWGSATLTYLLFGPVLGTLLPRGPWGF